MKTPLALISIALIAGCATAPVVSQPARSTAQASGLPPMPPLPRNARRVVIDGQERIYYHPMPKVKSANFDYRFHGAGMFNDVLAPDGTVNIRSGETGTVVITVMNLDDFADNLTVAAITNTVGHMEGIETVSLLPAPVTIPSYLVSSNCYVSVTNHFVVSPPDLALPDGVIQEDASVYGADQHDGRDASQNPQDYSLEFPNALRLLQSQVTPPNPQAPRGLAARDNHPGWLELRWTNLQPGQLYHLQISSGYPLQWASLLHTNWAGSVSDVWTNHVPIFPGPPGLTTAACFRLSP